MQIFGYSFTIAVHHTQIITALFIAFITGFLEQ
ncbi:photosystem I reaction center subunit XII [Sulfurospirillum diekertiae]